MSNEIWRKTDPIDTSINYVCRLKNSNVEVLKETKCSTGEIVEPNNELITTETITITRVKGEAIQF